MSDVAPGPLRVLVVDDERPARDRLLALFQDREGIEVVGAADGGAAALGALRSAAGAGRPVDLLFLDVQMPEVGGFDVLDALSDGALADDGEGVGPVPAVVFVTAYDRYALRAFDAQAVDYLLKPYADERFEVALGRAARLARTHGADGAFERARSVLDALGDAASDVVTPGGPYIDRIALRERGRVRLLPVSEVRWVGAAGVYVEVHTTDGETHLHRALLAEMEGQLDPSVFVRIHRSHLVRLDAVRELLQDSHGAYTAVLDDGTTLKLSRSYRDRVQERLGQSL